MEKKVVSEIENILYCVMEVIKSKIVDWIYNVNRVSKFRISYRAIMSNLDSIGTFYIYVQISSRET